MGSAGQTPPGGPVLSCTHRGGPVWPAGFNCSLSMEGQQRDGDGGVVAAIMLEVRDHHVLDMETWQGRFGHLSEIHQLEFLYKKQVKTDKEEQERYEDVLHFVVNHLIDKMKLYSPEFDRLFKGIYYTGSFWDGLTVNSTTQEFDLNIVFDWKTSDLEIRGLDSDGKKPNFCYLRPRTQTSVQRNREAARECIVNSSFPQSISPKKMFQLMQSSFDRAVTKINHKVSFEGQSYRVTRKVGAPINVQVRGLNNDMNFDVDLVPSISLEYKALHTQGCSHCGPNVIDRTSLGKLHHHVSSLCRQFGCSTCDTCGGSLESFMAISLHKADPDKFELDFHDLERRILFNRGCVKKVIKLMKYLRDIKGGPMLKLWSHLIKVNFSLLFFY